MRLAYLLLFILIGAFFGTLNASWDFFFLYGILLIIAAIIEELLIMNKTVRNMKEDRRDE